MASPSSNWPERFESRRRGSRPRQARASQRRSEGTRQACDVAGALERVIVEDQHDLAVVALGHDAGLSAGGRRLHRSVTLIAMHDLEGDGKSPRECIPFTASANGRVRDVAQRAVVAAHLAREVGQLAAQAAVGVVDTHEADDLGHLARLGEGAHRPHGRIAA